MKARPYNALCCVFFIPLAACQQAPPAEAPSEDTEIVAFVDVTVVPMDNERILEGHTVVVEGERIVAVGPANAVEIPKNAVTIDGAGKYLMPGLAEMHGHVPPPDDPSQYIEDVLFLYVANGITTVRGMQGRPGQLELRRKANNREIVSPTLYLAGPSFRGTTVDSSEQAIEMVREQVAEGWNRLKVHPGLALEHYDAMAETAKELGIRFVGHVPEEVGILHALEMGQETFDHLDGYIIYLEGDKGPLDEKKLADIVERTRQAGAWVVPTMAVWENLRGDVDLETLRNYPELKYMPADIVKGWIERQERRRSSDTFNPTVAQNIINNRILLLRALHEGGVPVLMGTDSPQQFSVPGFSLHRELERMVAADMSSYAILASGSKNVGDYFAKEDDFGTIAVGKRADMILVNANPLEDVKNIQQLSGVMVRGRWVAEEAIQKGLEEIEARYSTGTGD